MSNTHRTDILVIGGGPGGYAAAFRAADLGKQVTLVDSGSRLGGTCLLRGCIPSKSLLHIAALIAEAREAPRRGVTFGEPQIDLDRMRSFKDDTVSRLAKGLDGLMRKRKIEHIRAQARFESSQRVSLEGYDQIAGIDFNHAIIATGSRPTQLPIFALDSPQVLDSTTALDLEDIPGSMLVVGGGIIGLELGTVYAELGSRVTVVELTDSLLPGTDADLVKPLESRLRKICEGVHVGTRVTHVEALSDGLEVSFEGKINEPMTFDKVLVAVGRVPNTNSLGLEHTNVEMDNRGFIQVDSRMRTGDEPIYAIGDIVPGPGLAHKAAHEGKVVAEVLAGESVVFDQVIPSVVYTDPEVAWCGLTEAEARRQAITIELARFPWAASGRAVSIGRTEGLTKLVIEPFSGRVLGVGIVGPHAGDLISEGVVAVEMSALSEDLARTIHPHPTLSESIGIAAEIHLGTATDLFMPKR